MVDDNKNAEKVNSISTPHEDRTPTIDVRQEQLEAPTWAIGIQQAVERLIATTAQNIVLNRNQQNEQSQSQIQMSELDLER